jgi:2-methylcitrate dehydratase PrpD
MIDGDTALATRLVELMGRIRAEDVGLEATAAVRRTTLQVLGIARLGLQNPIGRDSVEYAARWEPGTAATIVAHGRASGSAASAAFANAIASHADFREDTNSSSSSHPGVVVIPAVLAVAEATGGTLPPGRYVEAVIAGYEIIGRIGGAAALVTTERGFRPPSVYTVFGAALGAALALGLDARQQADALAIAAQGASGINHPFIAGTDEWFLAPALAARQGVMAALLAREGVHGSAEVLEGEDGIFAAFAGRAVEVDLGEPGAPEYEIQRTRLKAALTCGWNQSLVHQLAQLQVPVDEVVRVDVRMSPIAAEYPGVDVHPPLSTLTEGLLSSAWAASLQLVRGSLDHSGYGAYDDPRLVAIAQKVHVASDPALQGYATVIDIELEGGRRLHSEDGNDHPAFSLDSEDRVLETLHRNYASAGVATSYVDRLVAGVDRVLADGDVAELADAIA